MSSDFRCSSCTSPERRYVSASAKAKLPFGYGHPLHQCPCAEVLTSHASNNVPENIFAKIGANLHLRRDHPICMIKDTIYSYFDKLSPGLYEKFDELKPVVSTRAVSPRLPATYLSLCTSCMALIGLVSDLCSN